MTRSATAKVVAAEGNKLEVYFDDYGRKKLMASYVTKNRLNKHCCRCYTYAFIIFFDFFTLYLS